MNNDQSDKTPIIGLTLAGLVIVLVPLLNLLDREEKLKLGTEAPAEYVDLGIAVDTFWRENFKRQFPDSWSRYRSPRVVFDDRLDGDRYATDDALGLYNGMKSEIRVDLIADREFTAFVIAHEFGHHVQRLAGYAAQRDRAEVFASPETKQQLGVRYELQAECLSGVWAHFAAQERVHINHQSVARFVGKGVRSADLDTHGTAEQRVRWFMKGYESGIAAACDVSTPEWDAL